jgi:DNA topoisomerase-1
LNERLTALFGRSSQHEFQVEKVEKQEVQRRPSPAFITSTLQQDAIKKFKWGAKKVMDIAQQLFEQGLISYMRTDSPNLSEEALKAIEAKLKAEGQEALFAKTIYQSKNNAQEAHEAIRPTNFDLTTAGEGKEQQELYSLIYRRAIASQMIPATMLKKRF